MQGQGLGRGDVVALMMENRPEYLIAWLGIVKAGGTAALINTNLTKGPLAHCLNISNANHLILGGELAENYSTAATSRRPMTVGRRAVRCRAQDSTLRCRRFAGDPLPADIRRCVQDDDAPSSIRAHDRQSEGCENPMFASMP